MHWLYLTAIAVACYASFNFFMKLAGDKIDAALGVFTITIATLLTVLLYFGLEYLRGKDVGLNFTWEGLFYSALAGISVAFVDIVHYNLYAKGAPVSIINPIVLTGSLIIVVTLGILFLKEDVNLTKLAGIAFAATGVYLLLRS